MATSQIFKKRKRFIFFLLILFMSLAIAFVSGFALAKASQKTKWVGWLVYSDNPLNYETMPSPGPINFRYSKNIVLGLRHDGVVVWKNKPIH
jgi:hypothetical protein